ncbi:hypothetical protein CEXT_205721 [Caerostris extrusa]|uniref:Uncharacterized protein n=1 Tax=Caerostris extrusa TaxID=172846 RepID=A0AAV4W4A9_CAEEX|nr:hypothetical protein CEXT_205721 [Caerostris extrusa]
MISPFSRIFSRNQLAKIWSTAPTSSNSVKAEEHKRTALMKTQQCVPFIAPVLMNMCCSPFFFSLSRLLWGARTLTAEAPAEKGSGGCGCGLCIANE